MAIGLEADHIDKIKLDAARGNISVSFTTNQQAVTIASYPVKDTFVTRGSIFDTDRIQLQMSPQFGEPPNQLIQTIRDLFQEAGAFNTQEGELRLAAGRDDQSPKPARAALMRHLCRSEDVIMNRASRQSA
ncbi:MAG: hypothetical protein OXU45_06060 [Candidatus Melainabacteria bacterium]|nr:hypothetical protein [Candidatus Melainabacteria bacterium]